MRIRASITMALWLSATSLHAAVVFVEPFASGTNGWSSFDLDLYGHSAVEGNPGAGSLFGTINAPDQFVPTLGAFYAGLGASGNNFRGDYTDESLSVDGRPYSLQFNFMAEDVIPGSLSLVLEGPGSTYFSFGFSLSGLTLGEWSTFAAPLEYSSWWFGGNETLFNNMLADVQSVEIQFNTAGSAPQTYYLDHVLLSTDQLDLSMIPEPFSGQLLFLAFAGLMLYRRAIQHNAYAGHPDRRYAS
jgi:hypothetical protein